MSKPQDSPTVVPSQDPITRRRFIGGAGAAAVSLTLLRPELVGGAEANSKIDIGLIGCGGRGKWVFDLFKKHGGYNLVAAFDYFQDRVDDAGQKFGIPEANRYSGLSGYKRLLDQKLDAVAIESPPFFHPEQAAASVDAGKHVYLAKPIAVDVPGCQTIGASGKKATDKKRAFLVDFQTRAHPAYQEAIRRVHKGDIGKIVSGEANYWCSLMFQSMDEQFRKSGTHPEARLRAWAIDRVLSGDVITEQNIHALDVASWVLNAEPIKACGTGGRARGFLGDCWDHFAVIFYYPNDVILSFTSKQVGAGWDDILCRVYGTSGTVDTHYSGEVRVIGDDPYKGNTANLYLDGAVRNMATFYDSVTKGDFSNPTVAPSVRSNLVTILGRMSAYQKREVTWDEMIRKNEKWKFDTKGMKG